MAERRPSLEEHMDRVRACDLRLEEIHKDLLTSEKVNPNFVRDLGAALDAEMDVMLEDVAPPVTSAPAKGGFASKIFERLKNRG